LRKTSEPTLRLLAAAAEPEATPKHYRAVRATYKSVAEKLGRGFKYIRGTLRRMGIELEDEPARPRFALAPFTLEQLALAPFTLEQLTEIHRRHHAGEGIRELANEFGVDVSLLRRRLANHGFSGMSREAAQSRRSAGCARALTVMSKPLVERAAALNAAGFNSKQIASTLNLPHADIIYRSMRRHGIEPKTYVGPRHAGWQRKLSDEQVKAAYLRFAAGERVKDIAASLGVSHCTIYWRFNDLGLPRFRERRKDWAGTPSLQKRRKRNA